jgi:hypothetical protein
VGFLQKLFRRGDDSDDDVEDTPITLDLERRRPQLLRLEQALDALATAMRSDHTLDDPGWRSRVNEYNRLAGDCLMARRGTPTRESLLDLVFEIRPVFAKQIPAGMEALGPLQAEVMAAADDLRELLPGEKG